MKLLALSWVSQGRGDPEAWARRKRHLSHRAKGGMSFWLSFHLPLLGPTGAYWLDALPDLSCEETTCQHSADGWPLSCNLLPCQTAVPQARIYGPSC
jgi:hypothetical protein